MADIIKQIWRRAAKQQKRIVFPEGEEARIVAAAKIIAAKRLAVPVLLGRAAALKRLAAKHKLPKQVELVDVADKKRQEAYAKKLYQLRQAKGLDLATAKKLVAQPMYFGTMMLKLGEVDGLVAGATQPTRDTLLPAFQIIKTRPGVKKVSGANILVLGQGTAQQRVLVFADCAVNPLPNAPELAEIALLTAATAQQFGLKPRVAMLSFSTAGSAKHPEVTLVQQAVKIVQRKQPRLKLAGEMQVDAALVPEVCQQKFPRSKVCGDANVLIFPDLNAGNIGYKLVERLAGGQNIGPILQGLKQPVNDLSRGCSVADIVNLAAITSIQAQAQ